MCRGFNGRSEEVCPYTQQSDPLTSRLANFMAEAFTPTVFVVDDDPSVRTAVKRLLASVGLPCETFSTAAEFLSRSEQGVSGCVVLDVRMPGASGLDLQRMLNEADTTCRSSSLPPMLMCR